MDGSVAYSWILLGRPVAWCIVAAWGLLIPVALSPAHNPISGLSLPTATSQTVVLLDNIPVDQWLTVASLLRAVDFPGVILQQTQRTSPSLRSWLARWAPDQVLRLPSCSRLLASIPTPKQIMLCPAGLSQRMRLRAAHLAHLRRIPFVPLSQAARWTAPTAMSSIRWELVGAKAIDSSAWQGPIETYWPDEASLRRAIIAELQRQQATKAVVVNPDDPLACYGPWLAGERTADLLFTDTDGQIAEPPLDGVDTIVLLGDERAIPQERRANPYPKARAMMGVEPFTPPFGELTEYAVGRLVGPNPEQLLLQLARTRLARQQPLAHAVLVSNPGGSLPLLQCCSQQSAAELEAQQVTTRQWFGPANTHAPGVRADLPMADLFVFEGHQETLTDTWKFSDWNEPLRPGLTILQSCRSLQANTVLPLFKRGMAAVVGTSTRTYSASGGAFATALINGLLQKGVSLGAALRRAKNFLLVYAAWKQARLGKQATMMGANYRAAWSFALWGDPDWQPRLPAAATTPTCPWQITPEPDGSYRVAITLPESTHAIAVGPYQATWYPGTIPAGLVRIRDHYKEPLAFLFVEFVGTNWTRPPLVQTAVPDRDWHLAWDKRRQVGYLFVLADQPPGSCYEFRLLPSGN